jgi:hypothetical protein
MAGSLRRMPKEQIDIHLRYEGPDVDDGAMSLQDAVPVLQGFASAYGKLATQEDPHSTHRRRITGVRPGSVVFALDVWTILNDNANVIASVGVLGGAGIAIVKKIIGVIRAKKHVRREPYQERIGPIQNTIIITNSQNVNLEMPLEVYELFKAGTIDSDLDRVTSPLQPGRIDAAEIEAHAVDGTVLRERIQAEDRQYFQTALEGAAVTATKETWLVAKLNSLTKSTNSGWLYLVDGTRAFYRYQGTNSQELHQLFGTYDGLVRVRCVAHLDDTLKVVSLDVFEFERVQGDLFGHISAEKDDSAEN